MDAMELDRTEAMMAMIDFCEAGRFARNQFIDHDTASFFLAKFAKPNNLPVLGDARRLDCNFDTPTSLIHHAGAVSRKGRIAPYCRRRRRGLFSVFWKCYRWWMVTSKSAGIAFTGPRVLSTPNSRWRSVVSCQSGLICALSSARVPNGERKTNMRKSSVSVHSGNSCWLQQVSICSLMGKFRLRSMSVPTRGFDEWYPRRRAPSWTFQNRLKLSFKSRQHFEARLGREL